MNCIDLPTNCSAPPPNKSIVDRLQERTDPTLSNVKMLSPAFATIVSLLSYLADLVGVREVHADKSPEEKLAIVQSETSQANTLFVGGGINDAPALMAATVGIAFGQNSDVTTEAAGAVIMDSSLEKVDEFMHISQRMRRIAFQSAVGGMALSIICMFVAAAGYLPPVAGAISQEAIDVIAVLNALRVALPPKSLTDFQLDRGE